MSSPRPSKTGLIWLAAIILVGGALRFYKIGSQSLWVDEVCALGAVHLIEEKGPLAKTPGDAHPPFYYWLDGPFVTMLGDTELGLRVPAAMAGIALLPLIYWLGLRMFSSEAAGLAATALAAISPYALWYSQEGRSYSLLIFLSTFVILQLWEIVVGSPRWWHWIGLTVTTILLVYTHTYGAFVSIACGVYMLAWVGVTSRKFWIWLFTQVLAASSLIPWVLARLDVVSGAIVADFTPRSGRALWLPYTAYTYLFGFSLGPSVHELHFKHSAAMIVPDLWWMVPMAAAGLWVGVVILKQALRPDRRQAGVLCFTWLVVPIFMAVSIPLLKPTIPYNVRYASESLPAFLLLAGLAMSESKRSRLTQLAFATLAVGMVASLMNHYTNPRYFKEANREVAAFLSENVDRTDVVTATSHTVLDPLKHYGFDGPQDMTDRALLARNGETDRVLESLEKLKADPSRRIWLIEYRPWEGDSKELQRQWLARNATPFLEQAWIGVVVRGYKLGQARPAGADRVVTP